MQRQVGILSGVAGFFWGAVLYQLLGGNWGRAAMAAFCACALSFAAYTFASRIYFAPHP